MTLDRTREFQGLLKLFGVTDLPIEVRFGWGVLEGGAGHEQAV